MKLGNPRLWISLTSLALVVALVVVDLERATPGPLTPVHAALPELAGNAGCAACHGRGDTDMASACAVCHGEIDTQLEIASGFHGALDPDLARNCASCHVEHHGSELPLVGPFVFARAGVSDAARFEHGHVAFELVGAHTKLECDACHANANVPWLGRDEQRYLGASQACATCHEDPHDGRYSASCATCHGQSQPFASVASFNHGDAFPLVGAHASASCAECHPADGVHAVDALALREPGSALAARGCADCHASPHMPEFVDLATGIAAFTRDRSCALCHDALDESFQVGAKLTTAQHAVTGFPLIAPHDAAACADCHGDPAERDFAARYPGRSPNDCAACHADPHAGQFSAASGSAFAGAVCIDCHDLDAFRPPQFGEDRHTQTAFGLTGAHRAADCASCHGSPHAGGGAVVFADADVSCAACHGDAHRGGLAPQGGASGNDCAACHTTERFDAVVRADFDHDCTRLRLDGAHAKVECTVCHVPSSEPDEHGRVFGRISPPPGGYQSCTGCHTDAHRGAFEEPRVASATVAHLVGDRAGCARCHSTESFTNVRAGAFDHAAWTGFALEGAHDAITCQACHGTAAPERALGFVADRHRGSTSRCSTCHVDVHRGAFDGPGRAREIEGRTDCARCHTTASFRSSLRDAFDHGLWTGFALDGGHAAAACASCHFVPRPAGATSSTAGALGGVRGSNCADCHTDPHVGQFAVQGRTDCARCHTSTQSFGVPAFDHTRDTRFALDQQHVGLACSTCHVDVALPGGGSAVRYKPLGTACIDCHSSQLGGQR